MSRSNSRLLCVVSSLCLLLQGPVLSAFDDNSAFNDNAQPTPLVQDVELRDGGILTTRVLDASGAPLQGQEIVIQFKGKPVASAVSDKDGLVAISQLRPGMHVIASSTGSTPCRFWAPGSAPPSAVSVPAVIAGADAEIIRGQFGAFNLPMVVYAGITAAAMVIAIDAKDDANNAEDAAAALAARVKALEDASP